MILQYYIFKMVFPHSEQVNKQKHIHEDKTPPPG